MNPQMPDVHQNTPLDDFAVAYSQKQTDYIASQISPVVPVSQKANSYYVWGKADMFRDGLERRAPNTGYAQLNQRLSTDSYICEQYAGERPLADEMVDNQDPAVRLEQSAVNFLMQQALIRRERMMAAVAFATGWTAQTDQAGVASDSPSTNQFERWDRGGSTPLDQLEAGIDAVGISCGRPANTIAMGRATWKALKNHAEIKDIIKATSSDPMTPAKLAAYLEVDRVLVSRAVYNTADEGATASLARIVGKSCFIGYVDPVVSLDTMTALKTFVWQRNGQYNPQTGMRLRSVRNEDRESLGVRGDVFQTVKAVCADAGCLYTDCVS